MLVVSAAAFLAFVTSSLKDGGTKELDKALLAWEAIRGSDAGVVLGAPAVRRRLESMGTVKISEIEFRANQLAASLKSQPELAHRLNFFTLHPEGSEYQHAVEFARSVAPSVELRDLDRPELRYLELLFSDDSRLDPIRSRISELRRDLASARTAPLDPALAQDIDQLVALCGKATIETLRNITQTEIGLSVPVPDSARLRELLDSAEKLAFSRLRHMLEAGEAQRALTQVSSQSVSVAGLDVPLSLLGLLLPWIVLGLGVECLYALHASRRWIKGRVSPVHVGPILNTYPWLLMNAASNTSDRTRLELLLVVVGILAHVACLVLLLPNVVGPDQLWWTRTVGVAGIVGLGVVLWRIVGELKLLFEYGRNGAPAYREVSREDEFPALARKNAKAIAFHGSTLLIVSTTLALFFFSIWLVPAHLRSERSDLKTANATRAAMEVVYKQRLLDHHAEYQDWHNSAFTGLRDLYLTGMKLSSTAVAESAEAFVNHEPFRTYVLAIYGIDEEVREAKANFSNLSIDGLDHLVHVLYVSDLSPLAERVAGLAREVAKAGLPPEQLRDLPESVKRAPKPLGPSIPVPFPYRTFVEKGGFLQRSLVPLPPRDEVMSFIRMAKSVGADKVAAFDIYADAMQRLDDAVRPQNVKVLGIAVGRQTIHATTWIVTLMLGALLWISLLRARNVLLGRAGGERVADAFASVPSLFLAVPDKTIRRPGLAALLQSAALVAWPALVLAFARADAAPSLWVGWNDVGLLAALLALALAAIERTRLTMLLRREICW